MSLERKSYDEELNDTRGCSGLRQIITLCSRSIKFSGGRPTQARKTFTMHFPEKDREKNWQRKSRRNEVNIRKWEKVSVRINVRKREREG